MENIPKYWHFSRYFHNGPASNPEFPTWASPNRKFLKWASPNREFLKWASPIQEFKAGPFREFFFLASLFQEFPIWAGPFQEFSIQCWPIQNTYEKMPFWYVSHSHASVFGFCPFFTHMTRIFCKKIAHLSRPWSIGWVALSFLFVCLFVRPAMVTSYQISTSTSPRPPNPYIFWKLMIIAIQKWIRNTSTKTKTNTKTMTKTKTPRE